MDFLNVVRDNIDIIKLGFTVIGGGFALHQWRIQIKQKRADMVKQLISIVRSDKDIAEVMDMIDWAKYFYYNGAFHLTTTGREKYNYSDEELFIKVDKTLAHFSYICYLLKSHALSRKDRYIFEYELRRTIDNKYIKNYLFSLYHWSEYLNVKCSYSYLIDYAIKHELLTKDFKNIKSRKYKCCLVIPAKSKKKACKSEK